MCYQTDRYSDSVLIYINLPVPERGVLWLNEPAKRRNWKAKEVSKMEKEKLYAIYCARCGEEIEPGFAVVISKSGNSYDTQECLELTELEMEIAYQVKYNEDALEYLNQSGKEESRIKK